MTIKKDKKAHFIHCKYDEKKKRSKKKNVENKSGNKLTTISQSHFDCYRVPWPDSRIYYALFF